MALARAKPSTTIHEITRNGINKIFVLVRVVSWIVHIAVRP
jgi:hypothetical protein